jgi:hypothetical protein
VGESVKSETHGAHQWVWLHPAPAALAVVHHCDVVAMKCVRLSCVLTLGTTLFAVIAVYECGAP